MSTYVNYTDALEVVHALAADNVLSDDQVGQEQDLVDQQERQLTAIRIVGTMLANGDLNAWPMPERVESADVTADPAADPATPSEALKLVIELGRGNVNDDPEFGDEGTEQLEAVILIEHFVATHGGEMDAAAEAPRPA